MSNSDLQNQEKTIEQRDSNLMDRVVGAINEADEQAAVERVAQLREKYPDVSPDALVGMLIKQKCLQAGAVGSVTSSASIIPGVGVFVSLVFGVAADIGMTAKMQAELVLEIAAAYQRKLSDPEKRSALIMVTGMGGGANQLLEVAGKEIAQKATARIARQSMVKAMPVLGIAASAGANMLSTYLVGRRANTYFSLGPEALDDGDESMRTITGLDEPTLVVWLAETTERSWRLLNESVQVAAGAILVAGKSAGEVIVTNAGKAGRGVAKGAGFTVGTVLGVGKKAGVGALAEKAGEMAEEARRGIVKGAGFTVGAVLGVGKIAGEGVITGAGKVGEVATDTGRGVAKGAGVAAGAVTGVGKKARESVIVSAGKIGDAAATVLKREEIPKKTNKKVNVDED